MLKTTLFLAFHIITQEMQITMSHVPPYYNTTPFSYQIFTRIENKLKTECYDTTVFTVNISATPTANDAEYI